MFRYLCSALILLGGFFMYLVLLRYNRLFSSSAMANSPDRPRHSKQLHVTINLLLLFFIAGFLVGLIHVLLFDPSPIFLFIGIVFFVGSVFALLLVSHLKMLATAYDNQTIQLEQTLKEMEMQNEQLQIQVDNRLQELMQQDMLLHTVNSIATLLLSSDTGNYDELLRQSLAALGDALDIDRVYLWKNFRQDGELYCTQLYEWSGGADAMQDTPYTTNLPFSEIVPGWEERLAGGGCICGPVKDLSPVEQKHLSAQDILSILIVPVHINEEFWGFVGFDDCHNERMFTDADARVLRSASLLIATSVLRNQMLAALEDAREEALASTRAKSAFLSSMSHEIRTPINAITGLAALTQKTDNIEQIHDNMAKISTASRQLLGIINDILDMSKIEVGKMTLSEQPFDLPLMIQNLSGIFETQIEAKKQRLHVHVDPTLPQVFIADDMRLSQILLNLMSNAVKFTPDEGEISVSLTNLGQTKTHCEVEIRVADTGIGITPEQQARLFHAFVQADQDTSRRFGGTGLGLAICAGIAEIMNGSISVESAPGEGSCFIVKLPLTVGEPSMLAKQQSGADDKQGSFTGKTALLVEDIEINREIVIAMLSDWEIAVDSAENGVEALRLFSEQPERYDIIFMDIHMPVMDGYETTQRLRELPIKKAQDIPIIAMTANAFTEDINRCKSVGMNSHVAKPIDFDALYDVMALYLTEQ